MKKVSIPGAQVWPRLDMFLKISGLQQSKLATLCGLKPQALSDIKAGRRHFSKKMADVALSASKGEAWEPWLRRALENAFTPPTLDDIKDFFVDDDDVDGVTPSVVSEERYARVPVLLAPCGGDPIESPAFHGEYVNIAAHIAELATASEPPYVLRVQTDDVYGRLRQGDMVLVAQATELQKEFAIVEKGGLLLLARSLAHAKKHYGFSGGQKKRSGWVAVDSGSFLGDGEQVGCVTGIVWAEL